MVLEVLGVVLEVPSSLGDNLPRGDIHDFHFFGFWMFWEVSSRRFLSF